MTSYFACIFCMLLLLSKTSWNTNGTLSCTRCTLRYRDPRRFRTAFSGAFLRPLSSHASHGSQGPSACQG
uniref:Putative secreted protein n=1 Tax=Anopheles darlingi TaxID=43151 RepID=A0A2M4DP25_ANODA